MTMSSEFGAFFRETREGLGLSLREFCRRTGFDQGNVSRLERGLIPPPRSEKVLNAYAKGLKLKPKSPEWERFMTLARPPAEPRQGQGHRNWVTASRLEDWAKTQDARNTLPQLVRRLIRATGEGIIRLEAPAEEQTQRPGWDVLVEASGNSEFVPQGVSGWELSTERDPKAKANKDLAKRQKNSLGLTKRRGTFILVTPRKYQEKGKWVEEKTKLKIWKELRFYDSATLEEWLECAPAVDIWLARRLGLCPTGVIDVDGHWENLKALTDPSFEAEVYLVSREDQVKKLREWLKGPPDSLVIESRSPAEAVDFIVAASRGSDSEEEFAARALIVETREAWRSLVVGNARLVLVVHPILAIEAELIVEAVRHGHHVIVCASGPPVSQCRRIELPRVSGFALQKALEAQGVDHVRSGALATKAGGSIAVLKRLTGRHPGTVHPEWSRPLYAREVVPLLLAGRWMNDSEGDRLALEELADLPYQDVLPHADRWSGSQDPMLTYTLSRWELVSRDDSWALLSHALNDDDLRRFGQVAFKVLGELDPACDLPSNKRWQANILGKVRKYSGTLRTGLAESLALLGARPPEQKSLSLDPGSVATLVVRSLLHDKDWKAWASLSSELPLLAEAAPDAFLNALEKDLSPGKRSPAVLELFNPDSSPSFGPHHHTGLLFALEGLAWNRNSLSRVSQLLASLHERAPRTKLGNSPIRTLVQVFMPWYPQTTAPVAERVRILETVSKRHPETGWRLLLKLLPSPNVMVSTNYRPVFQNWALQWSKGATQADYALQVEAFGHLVVELASKNACWLEAIKVLENLPPSARIKLLEGLASIDPSELQTDERRALAEAVREKINWHRRFANNNWEMKEPVLAELDVLRKRLEPDDLVTKNTWLFGDYWKVRWQVGRHDGSEEDADKVVGRLRAKAIDEIRSEKSWDGVLALAKAAEKPDQVGGAVGVCAAEGDDARVLPLLLTDNRRGLAEFAKGYVRARFFQQKWKWVEKLPLDQWSDAHLVSFALVLPSERKVWDVIAKRGPMAEEHYWKKAQISFTKNSPDMSRACTMLTKAGRPFDAARQLAMAQSEVKLDPSVIIYVLDRGVAALSDGDSQVDLQHGPYEYEVQILIQELQNAVEVGDTDVAVEKVADLEWKYLEVLDGNPTGPKILHTWLENKPGFLVDLLKILFPPSDEQKGERTEPSESHRGRAIHVYRLFNSWQRVPGSLSDGSIDENALFQWARSVQTLADKEGLRKEADYRVGNVFAHAPQEPDGTWPCIPVRDVIEEFGTETLTDGFEIGILNNRGAYWKALDEGGSQERVIAKQYFDWAEASRIEWPTTAASLRRVGEQYEADARRRDAETESR